jgi:vacuolar-type H+-ATPase subunit H
MDTLPGQAEKPPDQQDVLQHLLHVEANAEALVNRAQAEANRRIAENEKKHRAQFDEKYNKEITNLNEKRAQARKTAEEEFQKAVDQYQRDLESMPVDTGAFNSLLNTLFFNPGQVK